MNEKQIEKIIKSNMILQINFAGIKNDFEKLKNKPLDEEWIAYCWRKSLIGTRISYKEYFELVREVENAHNIRFQNHE